MADQDQQAEIYPEADNSNSQFLDPVEQLPDDDVSINLWFCLSKLK